MASYRHHYRLQTEREPKIIQLAPLERHITAVFTLKDGEFREPIVAIGLDDRGEVFPLSLGEDGILSRLDEEKLFKRVEF